MPILENNITAWSRACNRSDVALDGNKLIQWQLWNWNQVMHRSLVVCNKAKIQISCRTGPVMGSAPLNYCIKMTVIILLKLGSHSLCFYISFKIVSILSRDAPDLTYWRCNWSKFHLSPRLLCKLILYQKHKCHWCYRSSFILPVILQMSKKKQQFQWIMSW